MIYFDNAATGWPKPPKVSAAVNEALQKAGNPGRGAHESAAWAAEKVYSVREKTAQLFNIDDPLQIAFTYNATYALNMAINMAEGEIITTSMDHNSVLRPVFARGNYNIVKADVQGHLSPEKIISRISDRTGTVIMTHSSNVTGEIYNIKPIAEYCRKRRILFMLDCAQTAGVFPIDVQEMKIDVLCFPGHKGLLGPQGTGGIYVRKGLKIKPFIRGGTGSKSFMPVQPDEFPDCLESGTVNTHGLAGLGASIEYIRSRGVEKIHNRESFLRKYFTETVGKIPEIIVYGPETGDFTGTVSINVRGFESMETAQYLAEHGIAVRGGFHCAPLAHRSLGTNDSGTVRFSFGHGNNTAQIDFAVRVLRQMVATEHKI